MTGRYGGFDSLSEMARHQIDVATATLPDPYRLTRTSLTTIVVATSLGTASDLIEFLGPQLGDDEIRSSVIERLRQLVAELIKEGSGHAAVQAGRQGRAAPKVVIGLDRTPLLRWWPFLWSRARPFGP